MLSGETTSTSASTQPQNIKLTCPNDGNIAGAGAEAGPGAGEGAEAGAGVEVGASRNLEVREA